MALNAAQIKAAAQALGFQKVGIVAAQSLHPEGQFLREWIALGYHGKMGYMERGAEKRADPFLLLPSAKSVIALAINYYNPTPHAQDDRLGKISRYAWGDDYHDVIGEKLKQLVVWMHSQAPELEAKMFVDAGPMMDKAWAVRAGIGWLGKHTNVITQDYGSWIFLAEVLVNLELEYDENVVPDHCGTCTRCLDACPTNAIVAPYVVDARKCISYATIELKDSEIPESIKPNLKNWIFGCDICQDVCPWNRFAKEGLEPQFQPRDGIIAPVLDELIQLTPQAFKERFTGNPITRPKHAGLMRNVNAVIETNREINNKEIADSEEAK